jgi:GWxTD domain-containing protein
MVMAALACASAHTRAHAGEPAVGPSGALVTPIPVRESKPPLYALPGATATFGRDTAIALYLEASGADQSPVTLAGPGWTDTVALQHHDNLYSGVILVPLSRLAVGETTLTVTRGRDRITTPVFVGFGPAVNAASFDQLLGVLRYFAPADRLDSLRQAPVDERPRAWATFLARSREPLSEYLGRVGEANKRYGERGTPGWQTDRGSAYLQLGDPDQVFVEPDVEIWVYTRYFGRLRFDHHRLVPESRQMLATLVVQARSVR